MKSLRYRYFWLAGGIALLAIVLNLSLMPGHGRNLGLMGDKVAHFGAFFVLMIWFCGVFRTRMTPWVALGLMAFGVRIELLQMRVPNRSAELFDAFADPEEFTFDKTAKHVASDDRACVVGGACTQLPGTAISWLDPAI